LSVRRRRGVSEASGPHGPRPRVPLAGRQATSCALPNRLPPVGASSPGVVASTTTEVEYRAGALAHTIRAVGVLDLGVGILDRLRLSAFIPRLDIAVEGSAQLCTDEHFMVVLPPMEGELRRKTDVHIDVSLELWTKGKRRITVLELRDAAAVRQPLKDRREPFSPLTLEPGTPVSAYFTLEPADDGTLQASEGNRLTFGLRLGRNGRDRRVALKIGAPR
jgi:hypothetical protein